MSGGRALVRPSCGRGHAHYPKVYVPADRKLFAVCQQGWQVLWHSHGSLLALVRISLVNDTMLAYALKPSVAATVVPLEFADLQAGRGGINTEKVDRCDFSSIRVANLMHRTDSMSHDGH